MRDLRPRQVKLEADSASWPLGSLRVSRLYDMIEICRAPDAVELEVPLVELVELIQVLDWLSGSSRAEAE